MPQVPDTKENMEKCICRICPTFMQSDCPKSKKEGLYCAKGKTACNLSEKGCLCGSCPVHEENRLEGGYFCLKGRAK